MTQLHTLGLSVTVAFLVGLAIYTGTLKGKNEKGGSTGIVCGVILGTIIGGSSTIGTAQLAYQYGLSAWWYTIGAAVGCVLLALLFAKPLRASGCPTIVAIIGKEYGQKVRLLVSLLTTFALFVNLLSQILAAGAVASIVFPQLPTVFTIFAAAACMALYVVFGGTKGAGIVGLFKITLLYITMLVCGILALRLMGGVSSAFDLMAKYTEETGVNYFSFLSRGTSKDLSSLLSAVLGILSTQTYAQAIFCGRSDHVARRGGLISAAFVLPFAVFGILVGLYMRSVTDPAAFVSKAALTTFVIRHLPPLFGGVALGALFIASVGTGAGISLGVSTVLAHDLVCRYTKRFDTPKGEAGLVRGLIVVLLAIAAACTIGVQNLQILDFTFLSMGLRASVVFVPLCCALWLRGKIPVPYVVASVILGITTIVAGLILHADSMFLCVAVCVLTAALGYFLRGKRQRLA